MSSPVPASIPRRHDLDALRAIAMLLGIGLHAALSFKPAGGVWMVQDGQTSEAFPIFEALIHGFRMPLFFLISGFFTAMLWRKRGLGALIKHRFKRIFLPLVIGTLTIVPAIWLAIFGCYAMGVVNGSAGANQGANTAIFGDQDSMSGIVWAAATGGDMERLEGITDEAWTEANFDINRPHPTIGSTPLLSASAQGHSKVVQWLVDHGADANAMANDGNAPIHSAVFFGRAEVLRVLLDAGADVTMRNRDKATPREIADVDLGMTQGIGRMFGIAVEKDALKAGRTECIEILDAALANVRTSAETQQSVADSNSGGEEAAQVSNDGETYPQAPTDKEKLEGLIFGLTMIPVFHHLWFLWFLCWLVVGFAIYALVMDALKLQSLPKVLVMSWWRFAWLIPLTLVAQSAMGKLYPVFGPDTSVGLLPMPHVLFYYAIFFGYGALYFDCRDEAGQVGRYWPLAIALSLLMFPLGYDLVYSKFGLSEMIAEDWRGPASATIQVLYTWLMTFGLMGFFRAMLSQRSSWMRYISDSSYWLYLAHLPLVIVAQAIVTNWALPSFVKFAVICVVVTGFLLLTYEWMVRYTFIGALLNGPKTRPSKEQPVISNAT